MEVNIDRIIRDINLINSFNSTPGNGITRLTFTPEFMKAYNYITDELNKIGAEITICRAGCLRGRLKGKDPLKPPVMFGSHIDTVINGGRFDGIAGVVSALEVLRVFAENKISHSHPLDFVVFPEEEGTRFGIITAASSAWTGRLDLETLYKTKDSNEVSYRKAMELAGIIPEDESPLKKGAIKSMLELHIEQGAVLDKKGLSVGIVESIAGGKWIDLTVEGDAGHAGATPMPYRRDALQGAIRIIAELENIASTQMGPNTVGTCGFIDVKPGVGNVIPGKVNMIFDIRDSNPKNLKEMTKKINAFSKQICKERKLNFDMNERFYTPPVLISKHMIEVLDKCAEHRGIKTLKLMSGALHDSCNFSSITEIGMIFVPSKNGKSHCPEELTEWEDIKNGSNVLLDAVMELSK